MTRRELTPLPPAVRDLTRRDGDLRDKSLADFGGKIEPVELQDALRGLSASERELCDRLRALWREVERLQAIQQQRIDEWNAYWNGAQWSERCSRKS